MEYFNASDPAVEPYLRWLLSMLSGNWQFGYTVKIFGEEHLPYLEFDFDATFGNPKRYAGLSEADEESEKRSA